MLRPATDLVKDNLVHWAPALRTAHILRTRRNYQFQPRLVEKKSVFSFFKRRAPSEAIVSNISKAMNAEELVKKAIADHKVMVFSKSYCPYCLLAKKTLDRYMTDYGVMEIEKMSDCADIQEVLGKLTGATTVPRVFINGKCIGGGTECAALAKSGKLRKMLEEAGVDLLDDDA